MIITRRKKFLFKIAEIYFADNYELYIAKADIIIYLQAKPCHHLGKEFYTLHINLDASDENLFSGLGKNTRYKITRAAERDNITTLARMNPTRNHIAEFGEFYNGFARSKNLRGCNIPKMLALNDVNSLAITSAYAESGELLCYHAYIVDGYRARLLYSASHYRNMPDSAHRSLIGRANRYLHWRDISFFKKQYYSIYDFGGLSLNEEAELKSIDEFKMGFGGQVVMEYNFIHTNNYIARVAASLSGR